VPVLVKVGAPGRGVHSSFLSITATTTLFSSSQEQSCPVSVYLLSFFFATFPCYTFSERCLAHVPRRAQRGRQVSAEPPRAEVSP
jgi:hypothetical protein